MTRNHSARYAGRPVTDRERIAASVTAAGLIDFDPDGPVTGIDGATYRPGHISEGAGIPSGFVVLVDSAGMSELTGPFTGYEAQRRWLADRGPTAVGDLAEPETRLDVPPRLVLEERVLAGLLARPREFAEISFTLPPDSFTADARYEIYAAMMLAARSQQRWKADDLDAELAQRAGGGAGGPWALTYLRRLRQVHADQETTCQASRRITLEDSVARMRPGQLDAIRTRMRQVSPPPETLAWYEQLLPARAVEPDPPGSPRPSRGPAPNL